MSGAPQSKFQSQARESSPPEPEFHATPAQQAVLERIAAQRQRLRARCQARRQAQAQTEPAYGAGLPPGAPLLAQVVALVRAHPAATAAAVSALGLATGPRRALRWAGLLLPLLLRRR